MTVRTEFECLRPRRHVLAQKAAPPEQNVSPLSLAALERSSSPLPTQVLAQTSNPQQPDGLEQSTSHHLEITAPPESSADESATSANAEAPDRIPDALERAVMLRDEAVRFAAIACARALRTALTDNPGTINRFVDDALRACGRVVHATVSLHPDDAFAYRPQRDVDVIADISLERGAVIVQTENGAVAATIEQRAALLAKAVARE